TSLLLHYRPDCVSADHRRLPPCPDLVPQRPFLLAARAAALLGRRALADELRFVARAVGWMQLRPFPGYTGSPHHATAPAGSLSILCPLLPDKYPPQPVHACTLFRPRE